MGVKKAIVGAIAGVGLMLASAIPALADGFYVGGGASQWQVIANSVISEHMLSQEQVLIQNTNFAIDENSILNVNIVEYGYVEQEIGEESGAYTGTSNYAGYEIQLFSGGTTAASSAVVVTAGDAYGVAESFTNIEVNLLGE